jgi:hypothetical protein
MSSSSVVAGRQQRPAGHLLRLLDPQQGERRGRDVGEDALAVEPRPLQRDEERHRIE